MNLKIASEWIRTFSNLAKETNSMIVPTDVSDLASITSILKGSYDFAKGNGSGKAEPEKSEQSSENT